MSKNKSKEWLTSALDAEDKLIDVEGLVQAAQIVKLETKGQAALSVLLDLLEGKVAELRAEIFKGRTA